MSYQFHGTGRQNYKAPGRLEGPSRYLDGYLEKREPTHRNAFPGCCVTTSRIRMPVVRPNLPHR